jgi:hypothetical protein
LLPFTLLGTDGDTIRVSFQLDQAARQEVRALIDRISSKSAA